MSNQQPTAFERRSDINIDIDTADNTRLGPDNFANLCTDLIPPL